MPSAHIASLTGPDALHIRRVLALLVALALAAGCASPRVIRETPRTEPTATVVPSPVALASPTGEATAAVDVQLVQRVALATSVDEDGAPLDERAVLPEQPRLIYLCVQVRSIKQGSRFHAYWYEEQQVIGQSDKVALESSDDPVWIALAYQPIGVLNTTLEHSVQLEIDGQTIDRYVVRLGIGAARDAIAEAAFTSGFDAAGKPNDEQNRFHVDTAQLTLRVRISNVVDPTGMLFSTLWFRGGARVAQLLPDAPLPGQAAPDPRKLAFTWMPGGRLIPGDYRVSVLLNGNEVRSIPFVVAEDAAPSQPPTPAPAPAATPTPAPPPPTPTSPPATATPHASSARIEDIVTASGVDGASSAPLDGPLFVVTGQPEAVVTVWAAVSVSALAASDRVEVVVWQNDILYASVTMPSAAFEEGWVAAPIDCLAPPAGDEPFVYTFGVLLNGKRALDTSLLLEASDD
jgi:hypothetical protein